MTTRPQLHRRSTLIILAITTIVALLVWAVLAARHGKGSASAQQALPSPATRTPVAAPVVVAPAITVKDDVAVEVVGSALAASSITVFPATSGEVAQVRFSAGQRVKAGQVLVQLTDRSERLAVQLGTTRADAAARLLKRYEGTRLSGAVPATVIDEARLALRQAEIELAQAREQLRDRTVRAPFNGVVGIAQVDPGDRVTPDTALTTLDDRSVLSVSFQVPEPYLARLQRGQPVALRNVAYPGRSFDGTLVHIDSRIDPATRTVNVRAAVPNADDLLRPGMAFAVRLNLPGEQVVRVAELAVQWGREGSHVWVVRDNAAHQVPVRVVRRLEGAVLVDGDLREGEPVVVEGFHRLRPQRAVRVAQQRPAPVLAADGLPESRQ